MKRSGFLKRRTRLSPISKRKRVQNALYAKERAEHLAAHPRCQIGPVIKAAGYHVDCWGDATHVHHAKGRHGLTCDRRYFFSSCSGECHPRWVHQTNVKEAYVLGLLIPKRGVSD